jgi:CBS domain-containing protein
MQITNAMTRSPVAIRSDEALAKAKALMEAGGFRPLPVIQDGHLVGILTERDLRAHSGYLETTRGRGDADRDRYRHA